MATVYSDVWQGKKQHVQWLIVPATFLALDTVTFLFTNLLNAKGCYLIGSLHFCECFSNKHLNAATSFVQYS